MLWRDRGVVWRDRGGRLFGGTGGDGGLDGPGEGVVWRDRRDGGGLKRAGRGGGGAGGTIEGGGE